MKKKYLAGLILLPLLFTEAVSAMPFKCEKNQVVCEVQTKRLTVGDKVVVLNEESQLVAIGEVIEIKGGSRTIKITRKWATLARNHRMEFVEDKVYSNPEQFYPPFTPLAEWAWGVQMGVLTLGVGDTFTGSYFGGGLSYLIGGNSYLTGNLHYVSGDGKASDNLGDAGIQSVSVTSYGPSIGFEQVFSVFPILGAKVGGDLGISSSTVTLDGAFDEKKVLNNRLIDGTNLYFRTFLVAYWRRSGLQPQLGFTFTRIHQANNPGLFLGVSASIN